MATYAKFAIIPLQVALGALLVDAKSPIDQLREEILGKGTALIELFRSWDVDRDGKVSTRPHLSVRVVLTDPCLSSPPDPRDPPSFPIDLLTRRHLLPQVSKREFRDAVVMLCRTMDTSVIDGLFNKLDPDRSGKIEYSEVSASEQQRKQRAAAQAAAAAHTLQAAAAQAAAAAAQAAAAAAQAAAAAAQAAAA